MALKCPWDMLGEGQELLQGVTGCGHTGQSKGKASPLTHGEGRRLSLLTSTCPTYVIRVTMAHPGHLSRESHKAPQAALQLPQVSGGD